MCCSHASQQHLRKGVVITADRRPKLPVTKRSQDDSDSSSDETTEETGQTPLEDLDLHGIELTTTSMQSLAKPSVQTSASVPLPTAYDVDFDLWPLIPSRQGSLWSCFEADAAWVLNLEESTFDNTSERICDKFIPYNTISLTSYLTTSLLQDFENACLMALPFSYPCVDKTMHLLPWTA
jgi:hypothetical protein